MLLNLKGGNMQLLLEKNQNDDHCPNCGMPLEDSEVCNFCEWKRTKDVVIKGKKNEKSTN